MSKSLNKIIHGDSITGIKEIPDNYAHLILSDIPYGIGAEDWDVLHDNKNSAYLGSSPGQEKAGAVFKKRGKPINGWSEADREIPKQYYEWCATWASEWLRVLKPGGSVFIFAGRRYAHRCISALEDAGFSFKDMFSWMRQRAPHRAQRVSVVYERRGDLENSKKWDGWRVGNLRPTFEPVLWFTKPYKIGTTIADNVLAHGVGAFNEEAFLKYEKSPDNVLTSGFVSGETGHHPTQKPIRLMQALIELTTQEGQIVLDPFCGSGSTLIAAKSLGRKYIGFEANEEYVKVAEERLNLFGEIEPSTIAIEESASRLGVSTATIRNWIKTKYLEQAGKGRITLESLERFQEEVSGKEKLNQRANKSLKDTHDHEKTTSRFLGRISASDNVSEKIGIEYEESLSDSYRNKEGIYYTPSKVVRDLFSTRAGEISDSTFCDPCCGSGNFVVRAIELGFKPEHIYGYDVDPIAVEITKARIYKLTGYKSKNIQVANFLEIASGKEAAKFDCIYTNPPWGKKIPKEERALIGSMLGAGTSIDTCSLFFFACIRSLKENGELGLLLPEAFFNIASFEDARIKALQLSIERLIDYGKAFKGLVTKAQAIVLRNIVSKHNSGILCEVNGATCKRSTDSFKYNPKSILNFYSDDEDAATLQHLLSIPYITLDNKASWGLGIVTGNNNKFIKPTHEKGYIPAYKGADIQPNGLKKCSSFIPSDMSLYQQVAPLRLYQAKEKLVYKFISSKLCFFYDDKQRFFLNSANILIPDESFPVTAKVVAELLSGDFMNWVFSKIFNTHKILRGDLESLPIHSQFLKDVTRFDEEDYLTKLSITKVENGTYRIKR